MLHSKLLVRPGKTVYDDRMNVIGVGGDLLELDANIRESDKGKVTLVQVDDTPVDEDKLQAQLAAATPINFDDEEDGAQVPAD